MLCHMRAISVKIEITIKIMHLEFLSVLSSVFNRALLTSLISGTIRYNRTQLLSFSWNFLAWRITYLLCHTPFIFNAYSTLPGIPNFLITSHIHSECAN